VKTIEVRLHSVRVKPHKGLSEAGVRLAEAAVGSLGGAYHAYYAAESKRCRETLDAMGFPTYERRDVFGGLPEELDKYERELLAQQIATNCRYMEGYLAIPAAKTLLQGRGEELGREVRKIARVLHEGGRALVIAHAEAIELLAMAVRPDGAPGFPGGELRPLDGVAIDVVDGHARQLRVIRLPGGLGQGAIALVKP
jgi:hypothetical protein